MLLVPLIYAQAPRLIIAIMAAVTIPGNSAAIAGGGAQNSALNPNSEIRLNHVRLSPVIPDGFRQVLKQRLTLKPGKVGEQMKRSGFRWNDISGNISNEPIKKPSAPTSVNRRETVTNAEPVNWGRTTLNRAEIMNPTQPRRLVKVTHQEMLPGCQAQ